MGSSQSTTSKATEDAQHERAVSLCEKQLRALDVKPRIGNGAFRPAKDSNSGRNDGALTLDDFDKWQQDFESVPAHQVLGTILSQQDPLANLTSRKVTIADLQVFNHKLTTQLKSRTSQSQSGRCWLFAALNMARIAMAKKYNVDDFEFSQAYPMFYDHLNKANVFLENIIDLADEKLDSRIVNDLISEPVEDGGEWVFALNLFERYGVIPKALYPESFSSSNSSKMNDLVNTKLREHSLELRRLFQHTKTTILETTSLDDGAAIKAAVRACRARKEEQLSEIYTIITMCLGTPPSPHDKVTYEFYDKKGQYQSFRMTPLELFADLAPAFKPADCVSLVNQPNHELGKLYTVDRAQNVYGGKKTEYINTDIENLEQAVIKMIKADEPVWFACDARLSGDRLKGIWDVDVRDIEGAFGTKLGMNKADRLDSRDSYPSHAMMISGVHVVDGKPVRYCIENSWGESYGDKGYFVCTAEWFRQYTYEVIVPRKLAPPEAIKILEGGNPVVLPPWATMASRARTRRV